MDVFIINFVFIYGIISCMCSVSFEGDLKPDSFDNTSDPKVDYTGYMLQLFDKIDLNSDGVLSKTELDSFSIKMSKVISDRQLATEMDTIDKDKDGLVSLEELLAAFSNEVGEEDASQNRDPLVLRFNVADKNKDGRLDLSELGDLINPSRRQELLNLEVEDVLKAHDSDRDGRISFDEYKKYRQEDGEDETQSSTDFKQFDKDGDGFLTRKELEDVYREEEEFDTFTMFDDVTSIVGTTTLTREVWRKHANDLAKSSVTDFQELLDHPADYGFKFDLPKEEVSEVHTEL